MSITRIAYQFTVQDAQAIQQMGYQTSPANARDFAHSVNELLPGFNVSALLSVAEKYLVPTTTKKIKRSLVSHYANQRFQLQIINAYKNEDDALVVERIFKKDTGFIWVEHKYFVLPKAARGKGLMKIFFRESLQQYVNMGLRKIYVHAGLSDGGLAWAKLGFVATRQEDMQVIMEKAARVLQQVDYKMVEHIYNEYYTKYPKGGSFPIRRWARIDNMAPVLQGTNWLGELDLFDIKHLTNFIKYVSR